jgi:hypothetical protein
MKKTILKAVAAMGLLIGGTSAYGASITLTPVYLGFSSGTVAAFGNAPPTGLNTAAPSDTSYATAGNRYYFAVNMSFGSGTDLTIPEDFRSVLYNINLPTDNGGTAGTALAAATSRTGGAATYSANLGALNPTGEADLSGEAVGTSATTGFSNIFPNQTDGPTAFDDATGQVTPYTLGYFVVTVNDKNDANRTITLTETNGQNVSYFTTNSDL